MILPRLANSSRNLVISAGFDAHTRDPLANLNLVEADYTWVTKKLMDVADEAREAASFRYWKAATTCRAWRVRWPRTSPR